MFKRAFNDTSRQLGGPAGVFLVLASAGCAYLATVWLGGPEETSGAWGSFVAAIAAFCAPAVAMFLYNLSAAPYRTQAGRADQGQRELDAARASIEQLEAEISALKARRPNFCVEIEQVTAGGDVSVDGEASHWGIIAFITLSNVGTAPSAISKWWFVLQDASGAYQGHLFRADGVSLSNATAGTVQLKWAESIMEKSTIPIEPGAISRGFLGALFPLDAKEKAVAGAEITVCCRDAYGNDHVGVFRYQGEDQPFNHLPGMGSTHAIP